MSMRKQGDAERNLEVLSGLEAQALNDNFSKTGKRAVSDFSEDELKSLNSDLDLARKQESDLNSESGSDTL